MESDGNIRERDAEPSQKRGGLPHPPDRALFDDINAVIAIKRMLATLPAIAIWIGLFFFNAVNLWGAFGTGPPFYDRSVNMDKWVNPWPVLLLIDLPAIAISYGLLYWGWRRRP